MMGIHKLTAGDGYLYLVRQVAAADATSRAAPRWATTAPRVSHREPVDRPGSSRAGHFARAFHDEQTAATSTARRGAREADEAATQDQQRRRRSTRCGRCPKGHRSPQGPDPQPVRAGFAPQRGGTHRRPGEGQAGKAEASSSGETGPPVSNPPDDAS